MAHPGFLQLQTFWNRIPLAPLAHDGGGQLSRTDQSGVSSGMENCKVLKKPSFREIVREKKFRAWLPEWTAMVSFSIGMSIAIDLTGHCGHYAGVSAMNPV
jgi:hypothetical protein